jgi:hypothetical protein
LGESLGVERLCRHNALNINLHLLERSMPRRDFTAAHIDILEQCTATIVR